MGCLARTKSICKICISAIAVLCVSALSSVVMVEASGTSSDLNFSVGYAQPTCNDNSGYVSVVGKYGSEYRLVTYFWTFSGSWEEVGQPSSCEMEVTIDADKVILHPYVFGDSETKLTLGYFGPEGDLHMMYYGTIGLNTYENIQPWSNPIVGYVFGGNATGFNGALKEFMYPTIYWNNSVDSLTLSYFLNHLGTLLGDVKELTYENLKKLDSIYNADLQIMQKLNKIINELTLGDVHQIDQIRQHVILMYECILVQGTDAYDTTKFRDESAEQSGKLDNLNKDNKVDKVDIGKAGNSVDENLDMDSVAEFGSFLSVFTEESLILIYLLIVFSVALLSYVLFGKR